MGKHKPLPPIGARIIKSSLGSLICVGIYFIRELLPMMEPLTGINLKLPVIAMDGAVLYDIRENRYLDVFALEQLAAVQVEGIIEAEGAHAFVNVLRDNTLLIYYGEFRNDAERDMFEHLRCSPYRNYTGKRFRNDAEREQVLYIMALTRTDHAQKIAGRIQEQLGGRVRVMLYPASEYEGYTYLKVYAADACKANMLKILQTRIGAERVITFGSIPGQYDVYVHDDGGNSAVKMLKKLYEGKKLEDVLNERKGCPALARQPFRLQLYQFGKQLRWRQPGKAGGGQLCFRKPLGRSDAHGLHAAPVGRFNSRRGVLEHHALLRQKVQRSGPFQKHLRVRLSLHDLRAVDHRVKQRPDFQPLQEEARIFADASQTDAVSLCPGGP